MLRDNGQNENLVSWNDFRPNTDKQILEHYYGNSTGTISNVLIQYVGATAGLAAGLVGADPAAARKVTVDFLKKYRSELASAVNGNQRSKLDSNAEKSRIISVYKSYYQSPGNQWMQSFLTKSAAECKTAAATLRAGNLENATRGCAIGDTAGCRWQGLINCQIQYLTFLAELKEAVSTIPPGQPPIPPKVYPPKNGSTPATNTDAEAKKIIPLALASYLLFNF